MLHATINAHIGKKEVNMNKNGVSDENLFWKGLKRISASFQIFLKTNFATKIELNKSQTKNHRNRAQNKLIIKYHQINQSASLQIELNHTFSLASVAMKTAKKTGFILHKAPACLLENSLQLS